MRALTGLAATLIVAGSPALAAGRLTPDQIKATFFDGKAFAAATPSNIQFTMTFTPDGHVTREPVGKSGVKGIGTWKLSKEGFCTTWKGNKAASCFVLVQVEDNKWSVVRGAATVASWSKAK